MQFGQRSALFAFPPPEMARVMGGLATGATGWGGVGVLVRPLFVALDTNVVGRELLCNLVKLHREHPELRCGDNYCAEEMRSIVEVNVGRIGRRFASLVGYFTDGVRAAFEEWSVKPEQSTIMVAEAIGRLVTNPPAW